VSVLDYQNPKGRPKQSVTVVIRWIAVGLLALLIAIILMIPSPSRAGPAANRVRCASNLRQIATAMHLYANENGGAMVPDLFALLDTQDMVPEVFTCPQSPEDRAPGTQPAERRAQILAGGHLSYIYIGGQGLLHDLNPLDVIMFEPLSNHGDAGMHGMNVLHPDGMVEWIDETKGKSILAQHAAGVRPIRVP
jgi:hypothetical protein